jgi:hypothetical protein
MLPIGIKSSREHPLTNCEPVTLVTPPDVGQPQAQDSSSKLEDVTAAAKPHLTNGEFRELEETRIFLLGIAKNMGGLIRSMTV